MIAGKQGGSSWIIEGPPSPHPPPRIAKNTKIIHMGLIYETLVVIISLDIHVCSVMRSYCPENLVTLGLT